MASIDNLITVINRRDGVARSNRFQLSFALKPLANSYLGGENTRDLRFLCESVTLPGRNYSTFEYEAGGFQKAQPYTFIDGDVSATFLVTNDSYARKVFDAWQRAIGDPETYRLNYKEEYVSDVYIDMLDAEGNYKYGMRLENAYPATISDTELSNASENEFARLTVTFKYDKYVSLYEGK